MLFIIYLHADNIDVKWFTQIVLNQLSNIRKSSHSSVKTFDMTKMFNICITSEKLIWKIERLWQIEIEMTEERLSCLYSKLVCFRGKALTCCNRLLQASCEFMFYETIESSKHVVRESSSKFNSSNWNIEWSHAVDKLIIKAISSIRSLRKLRSLCTNHEISVIFTVHKILEILSEKFTVKFFSESFNFHFIEQIESSSVYTLIQSIEDFH